MDDDAVDGLRMICGSGCYPQLMTGSRGRGGGAVGQARQLPGGIREVRRGRPALAVSVAAALVLGVVVEEQFQVISLHDPSGGWSGWIWETQGLVIVDRAVEGMRTDTEVDWPLALSRP